MSTDDLDNFFAKKDKKKSKSKSKFTPEELLEQKGDVEKKKKKKSKPKDTGDTNQTSSTSSFLLEQGVKDEDWIEIDAEKEVDYTGLKITNLQISKETEEENTNEEEEEYDEEGERKPREESGPWQKIATTQPTQPVQRAPSPVEPVEKAAPEPEVDSQQPKKYVPPAARRAAAMAAAAPQPQARPNRYRKKEAPDMGNEFEFPSLGATSTAGDRLQDKALSAGGKFETVRSGGNRDVDMQSGSKPIELVNNRFATN